jgi:EAL and modified HD-GYP domain-containing signal transduction protein
MATRAVPVVNLDAELPAMESELCYMARQPILDQRHRVCGYELLFRSGPETAFRGDGDQATRIVLDNVLLYGLEKLTAGLPAFVNCTAEALTGQLVDVLPSGMAVLEILENLQPTPGLIDACRKLKSAGFRLALDDFTWKPGIEPLVELADYIKVDFRLMNALEREKLLQKLKGFGSAKLIAEKVETQAEYQQACMEGFTLFQGYYFCRPVLMKETKIPANRLSYIQILEQLQHDPLDLHHLSQLLKRDTSLTYRLLRLVNSPVCAIRQEVRSIALALALVGDNTFRHIATLAIASEFNAKRPQEILRMSFVRGRFCEQAAEQCKLKRTEQYLLGMLSLLPAMLRVPMAELVPTLPLRKKIREALMGADSREHCLLHWIECCEQGDWSGCDAIVHSYGLNQIDLIRHHVEAVAWADDALNFAL